MTFETYGIKYTWETDHSDLELSEVMNAFYKLLIAQGFDNESILEEMERFANDELCSIKECVHVES